MKPKIDSASPWQQYLIKYFKDSEYSLSMMALGSTYRLKINNILDTYINFTDQNGFLRMEFNHRRDKAVFFIQAEMSVITEERGKVTYIEYNYNREKYPCRVFPHNSILSITFYDDKDIEDLPLTELFEYRKSILDTIVSDIQKTIES